MSGQQAISSTPLRGNDIPATRLAAVITEGGDAPAGRGTPYVMGPNDTFRGTITSNDVDWVRIQMVAGQQYTISLDGVTLDDTYLELRDSSGALIAYNDDAGSWDHSQITFTATTSGTYYLTAQGYSSSDVGSYELSVSVPRPWSNQEIADYLRVGFWQDVGEAPRAFNVAPGGTLSVDMTDLSAAEKQVARQALQAWTEVTGIRFNTNSTAGSNANLHFVNDDTAGAYSAPTAGSGSVVTSAMVNIPVTWSGGPSQGWASYFYQTYLHEIGHALGLGHAGNYNGTADYGVDNHYVNDSWQATVMSYFSQSDNTYVDASYAYVVTPMIADILAMQQIYGSTGRMNATASVWGEGSNINGAFGLANRLMVQGSDITMTILDQGGNDWLKLGSDRHAQLIRLGPGSVSDVYGLTGNLSIAAGTVIENVIAGQSHDRIFGNAANNWLVGMGGRDTIRGEAGNDTLEGGTGADHLIGGTGNDLYVIDAGDTLVELANGGIDRVRATFDYKLLDHFEALLLIQSFARYGTGNSVSNTIVGNSQVNYLSGGGGSDTLFGMNGNDTLVGNAGADRLVGGAGNDVYIVDAFDTVVEAVGGGIDTVRTHVNFTVGAHIERIEVTGNAAVRVVGNAQGNTFVGNGAANTFFGGGGYDVMTGGGGADIFVFTAGQGGRVVDFQNNIDEIRINGAGALTVNALLNNATVSNGGVNLRLAGDVIRVEHTTIAELRDDILLIA